MDSELFLMGSVFLIICSCFVRSSGYKRRRSIKKSNEMRNPSTTSLHNDSKLLLLAASPALELELLLKLLERWAARVLSGFLLAAKAHAYCRTKLSSIVTTFDVQGNLFNYKMSNNNLD